MPWGLGLDVGGTQCRWALADPDGRILKEGLAGAFNGQLIHTPEGRSHISAQLAEVAAAIASDRHGHSLQVWAGVTGYDGQGGEALGAHIASCLSIEPSGLRLFNDVELAHRVSLAPGSGYLIYAGTGCIATFLDEHEHLYRVGGRGETLGDDGSGYWIGCQALKAVWRAEDERPGFTETSPLAQALFARVGGPRWEDTRRFIQVGNRGDVGRLAVAVASVISQDPMAQRILQHAGRELARLARLLILRHGVRPVWLAGGAFDLHPMVQLSLVHELPADTVVHRQSIKAHRDAALKAACNGVL